MIQYPNIHQLRRLLDTLGQGIVVRTGAEATGWMIMAEGFTGGEAVGGRFLYQSASHGSLVYSALTDFYLLYHLI